MSTKTKKLSQLLRLMETIGEETQHEDISLHQVKTLLYVAIRDEQNDPAESREVAAQLGLSTSGVSRAVASLGEHGRGNRAGLNLLHAMPDLQDRRRKPLQLTKRGRKAIEKILEAT